MEKQSLYPDSRLRMTNEVLEAYIQQLLASHPGPEVYVAWQGGEPALMGLEFFERSVELAEKHKKPGQRVTYTFQTNGTLLDDAWCAFFRKQSFLVGLSMDGPAPLHDAYRVARGGQGSFDQARRAWDLLQSHRVDTNILCAVHAANAPHPLEVYRFFRDDLRARFVQFIAIVERAPAQEGGHAAGLPPAQAEQLVSPRSVRPEQYGRFLTAVFDEWVRRDVGEVFVQTFDAALASWCGMPAGVCIAQETCGLALVLEHNGDVYSCDHFVGPAHRLGNILEAPLGQLVVSARQRQFGFDKRDRLPTQCRKCDVRFACQGECPRNRFVKTAAGEEGLNYLCAGYKDFFHHIDRPMRVMRGLLRQKRPPAEIMATSSPDERQPAEADQ